MDSRSAEHILELFIEDAEQIIAGNQGVNSNIAANDRLALRETLEALRLEIQIARDRSIARELDERDYDSEVDSDTDDDDFNELLMRAQRLVDLNHGNASHRRATSNTAPASSLTSASTSNATPALPLPPRLSNRPSKVVVLSTPRLGASGLLSGNHAPGGSGDSSDRPVVQYVYVCMACEGRFSKSSVVDLHCKNQPHRVCQQCLKHMFSVAIRDEAAFPARCCQEIPIADVESVLGQDLAQSYREKMVEYSTSNRVYCVECHEFIPPRNIRADHGTCRKCGTRICTICKQRAHQSDCPNDPDLEVTLDLAAKKGWKRCRMCQRMIELFYGCNHMT